MYGVPSPAMGNRLLEDPQDPPPERGRVGGNSRGQWGSAYEHNRRLQAHRDRITAMRRCNTYGPVAIGLDAWLGVMHQPTWSCEPGDDSPAAQVYADHLAACLGIGRHSPLGVNWAAKLEELLTACLYGFGLWETIPENIDGVWYTRLLYRDPASISHWVVDESDRLVAAEQVPLQGFGTGVVIPMSQLLHIVWRPVSADDYTGVGMLRAVEPLYNDAVTLQQLAIVAAQRWAVGTPTVTLDEEMAARYGMDTPELMAAELAKAKSTVKGYTSHEQAHITHLPWVKLGDYGGDISQLPAIDGMIDARDRRILTVWLQQWLMLGSANAGGSYSLGDAQVRAGRDHAGGVLSWLCQALQTYIARAVRWQFGPVQNSQLPRLRFDGLASEAFVEKLTALPSLVSAGLLVVDDTVTTDIRRALEFTGVP